MKHHQSFIKAQTSLRPVDGLETIRLYQADEVHGLWHMSEDHLQQHGLQPPFWAFAWAGGVGLSRFILDHPALFCGKTIVDFASGSGLVAIAAKMAGASHVLALDIDPFSIASIGLNAQENAVDIMSRNSDIIGTMIDEDILLAGDIFYDRALAQRLMPWFLELANKGKTILLGDPDRAYLPKNNLQKCAEVTIPVSLAIEDNPSKQVSIWKVISN